MGETTVSRTGSRVRSPMGRPVTPQKFATLSAATSQRLADFQVRTFAKILAPRLSGDRAQRESRAWWWLWVAMRARSMQTANSYVGVDCNTARQCLDTKSWVGGWSKEIRRLNRTGRRMERFIQLRWRSPFHPETDSRALMATVRLRPCETSFKDTWAKRMCHGPGPESAPQWGDP